MKLVERSSKAQEDGNHLKELQDHARTYLFRGEYTQAWILYARISVLLQEKRLTKPKASASMLEIDFEVRHQMAMKAIREGELNVAKQAFEELKKEHESLGLPQTVRWSLDHWLSVVYIELGSYKPAISLAESITRSVESQMNAYTMSYLEKLPDHRAKWLVLTENITSSVGPQMWANTLSYLKELPEHQAEWLAAHAKALTCLAKAREGQKNQLYGETVMLFDQCKKTFSKSTEWNDETESNQTNDWKRPTHKEQSLRYMLTVAQVLMLVGRRRDAKFLIEHENYKDCARVLGKSHPLSIERLILQTELLLAAASKDCDETFRELQNAMQRGYARLHPLTLSMCELQLAIFLKQGRLTEAMNATKDLISRIGAAHLGKNHFRSLQARRWRVRVLFERGEVSAALHRSKELTSTCELQKSSSLMHTFPLACVVDSILMHLRLRHYGTAENTVLDFLDELQISGEHTPGPDVIFFSSMAPKDVVPYLLELPQVDESNAPVEQAFATFYLTALQCLYICYLARKALSPEILDTLAEYLLDRRVRQSIDSSGDLESLMLLYDLAVVERELKDFDNALKHLQEAQTGLINYLGHEHPHTLMVDFELMLVRLLRHQHDRGSETEKPLIGIEGQRALSSGHGQHTVDFLDVLQSIQMQKKVLIRLDNLLGGSHIFTVSARIDLVNVLWEFDDVWETGNLELEVIWYLLPCKRTSFPETPVLPFTASETKHQSWSQNQARVLRSKIHHEFDALLIHKDGTVQPIDERFLSAIASFAYNEHGREHYEEAVTAQHAYAALCKYSGMDRAGLAEVLLELGYMRLELGYMHQSCAETCSDPTMSSERYMQAMKIYKDILQTEDMTPLYNAARSCLGAIYFRQGNFLLARNEQEKVYQALKEIPTDDTYTFLDSIYNLALTEKLLNNNDRAISLCKEGRNMSSSKLGFDDEQTKLFNDKLRNWDVPLTRPSSAAGMQHGNQRDSVMASSPKKHV